jgi:magnesium chelatase subunit D
MTQIEGSAPGWADACLVARLFAIDPVGLGGVVVRGGPGPVRDAWSALVRALLPPCSPVRRMPLHIDDDRLLGGLDMTASLAAGRPIAQRGLLAESDGARSRRNRARARRPRLATVRQDRTDRLR